MLYKPQECAITTAKHGSGEFKAQELRHKDNHIAEQT